MKEVKRPTYEFEIEDVEVLQKALEIMQALQTQTNWTPYQELTEIERKGWMLGQAFIGISCGIAYKKIKPIWINIILTILAVFIGIGLIKTGVECKLYDIPLLIKLPKNVIAFVADSIPMILGYVLAKTTKIKALTE